MTNACAAIAIIITVLCCKDSSSYAHENTNRFLDASKLSNLIFSPLTHVTATIDAIKSSFGIFGSSCDADASSTSNSDATVLSKRTFNATSYVTRTLCTIKSVFESLGWPFNAERSPSPDQEASASTWTFNPLPYAFTMRDANNRVFETTGVSSDGKESSSSAPDVSKSAWSFSGITHAITALGNLKGVFGPSGSSSEADTSTAPSEDASQSKWMFIPLRYAATTIDAIKYGFGISGSSSNADGSKSKAAASESTWTFNPLTYATTTLGAIRNVFGTSGSSSETDDDTTPSQDTTKSTWALNPLSYATTAVDAIKHSLGISGSSSNADGNKSNADASESTWTFNPLTYATTTIGAIRNVFGTSGSSSETDEDTTPAQDTTKTSGALNPLTPATTVVDANKYDFAKSGSSHDDGSISNSDVSDSKRTFNPTTNTTTDANENVFGTSGSSSEYVGSSMSSPDASESTSTFNPLIYAAATIHSIKSNFGILDSFSDANSSLSDLNDSISTWALNVYIHATTTVDTFKRKLGISGSSSDADESSSSFPGATKSSKFSYQTLFPTATDRIDSGLPALPDSNTSALPLYTPYKEPPFTPLECSPAALDAIKSSHSSRTPNNAGTDGREPASLLSDSPILRFSVAYRISSAVDNVKSVFQSGTFVGDSGNTSGVSTTLLSKTTCLGPNSLLPGITASAFKSIGSLSGSTRCYSSVWRNSSTGGFIFDNSSRSAESFDTKSRCHGTLLYISGLLTGMDLLFQGPKRKNKTENKETQCNMEHMNYDFTEMWSMLECPVCYQTVLPPVYQCKEGHHACSSCWTSLRTCPLCRHPRTRKRNFLAEDLVHKIPLPCQYRVDGCMDTVSFNIKAIHEEQCTFRVHQCPIHPQCNQEHNYSDMCMHLKNHHEHIFHEYIGERENFKVILTMESLNIVHAFHIEQWGLFFLQHATMSNSTAYFVKVIYATTHQTKYSYSLEVSDQQKTRREYFRGRVSPMSKSEEEIIENDDYLILPELILKKINNGSPLIIVLNIWKEQPSM